MDLWDKIINRKKKIIFLGVCVSTVHEGAWSSEAPSAT